MFMCAGVHFDLWEDGVLIESTAKVRSNTSLMALHLRKNGWRICSQ